MICTLCKEVEVKKGSRCEACKEDVMLSTSTTNPDFRWRVAIKDCPEGHKYVPVKGRCLYCEKQRNYETIENLPSVSDDTTESDVAWRWVL